jgi:hypothetical protein
MNADDLSKNARNLAGAVRSLTEGWRQTATRIAVKYPPQMTVQINNVTTVLERCAEELEKLIAHETLETPSPQPPPAAPPLRPVPPPETHNPS